MPLKLSPTQTRALASQTATEIIDANKRGKLDFPESKEAQLLLESFRKTALYKKVLAQQKQLKPLNELDTELRAFYKAQGKTHYNGSTHLFVVTPPEEIAKSMEEAYLTTLNPYKHYDRNELELRLYNKLTIATIDSSEDIDSVLEKLKAEYVPTGV